MKNNQKRLTKQRICIVSRTIACVSFSLLTILGISSIVGAMSLETIDNEDGVPSSWQAASLIDPDTITLPITYWDQRLIRAITLIVNSSGRCVADIVHMVC